ncbi:MAG: lipid-A-disaccharide synthase [Alphaproteobacteria bacterium]|nr:lipid-A-disaccharide synthase [Alphaproteobacteria bacterium]
MSAGRPHRLFIIAGEPSGDALGAGIMGALDRAAPGVVAFDGIGGPAMQAAGLVSRFPMSELAVMGLVEILPHLRLLLRRIRETVAAIEAERPAAVVTIDAPGFCFRVAERLKGKGIPLIHVVAPTVWAWKPGRAQRIARFLDRLLVLLPFEPPYFTRHGLATDYIGHPAIEAPAGDGAAFRTRHGIDATAPVLCVLPGSRRGEVARLIGPFVAAVADLARTNPNLRVVVPTVAAVRDMVGSASWPAQPVVVETSAEKRDAFAASTAALAASGTVALELALAGVPAVVAYRLNPLTYQIVKRMVRVRYVNLANLILDRPAVPELLQDECRPERLAGELARLLADPAAHAAQIEAGRQVGDALGRAEMRAGGPAPTERAAKILLDLIGESARLGPRNPTGDRS